jgi:gluconate 5-dehydrogenase
MSVRNLLDLSGKTAIVTGGSRGIGLQMAEALGEMGAKVALTARKQDELDESRAELERAGVECHTIASDLAKFDTIPGVVSSVLARWGQIDILVNNAGCNWAAPAEDYPDEGWRKVMSLNIDAQFFLCREVGKRAMLPRRSGKIINADRDDAHARRRMGPAQHQRQRDLPGLLPVEDDQGHARPHRRRRARADSARPTGRR